MKKTILLSLLIIFGLLFFPISLFADNLLSNQDLDAIKKFMNYRPELTAKSPEEALVLIENYRNEVLSDSNKANYSEQGNLILDTLLVLERFNYLYEINEKHPELADLVIPHNKMLEKWINNHKAEEISSWLYVTAGDLLSCSMGLYSIPKAMEIGLVIKDYYEIALEKNPNMAYGNLNMAQWYFHAPAIGGGSKKKADELFQVALKNAFGKGEEFYVNMVYSQFLLDQKNKAGASSYFEKAYTIQPDSKKLQFIKLLNDNGYTLFYYTLNREKVEKKLGL